MRERQTEEVVNEGCGVRKHSPLRHLVRHMPALIAKKREKTKAYMSGVAWPRASTEDACRSEVGREGRRPRVVVSAMPLPLELRRAVRADLRANGAAACVGVRCL